MSFQCSQISIAFSSLTELELDLEQIEDAGDNDISGRSVSCSRLNSALIGCIWGATETWEMGTLIVVEVLLLLLLLLFLVEHFGCFFKISDASSDVSLCLCK